MRPVIVTCAVTGSATQFRTNPAVPVTPEEIATSALEAADAGAAMVHVHVRDPDTGAPVGHTHLYREVVERIADAGSDVIVNLTCGYGGRYVPSAEDPRVADPVSNLRGPEERTAHVAELRPEVCSLDVATMNFGEQVFMNTPDHLRRMAAVIRAAGTTPEIEVFEAGHVRLAAHLIETGVLARPGHFQLCLGIDWSMPATPEAMAFLRSLLPADATWSAFGISRHQFPIVAEAVRQGGHVRVGLEDNIYLERGVLAPSNAALVERAVRIVEREGARAATPAEARRLLGLAPRPAPVA